LLIIISLNINNFEIPPNPMFHYSITIDDVVYVVDTGKTKEGTFDISRNIACLDPVWVSQASVKQRQGRAGRQVALL